jgi:hypothetical protein
VQTFVVAFSDRLNGVTDLTVIYVIESCFAIKSIFGIANLMKEERQLDNKMFILLKTT